MNNLQQIFKPHQFGPGEKSIDFWHVYNNLSRTPYESGVGIQCRDPDQYYVNAWHVITPKAMRRHLDWRNRVDTQFISFYEDQADAKREAQRRRNMHTRERGAVRIAHINIPQGSNVWFFSRQEMLDMMRALGDYGVDLMSCSGSTEWFVWGRVWQECVLDSQSS
ncbi:hypothetical protein Q7P35_008824 [Cladosporium inversicolor]